MLKYKAAPHDAGVRERLTAVFAKQGVEAERIEMLAGTGVKEYMADFNRVDLGLDPFPFNGGTTTFNEVFIWGCRSWRLAGRGHAERMGAAAASAYGEAWMISWHRPWMRTWNGRWRRRRIERGWRKFGERCAIGWRVRR